MLNRHTAIRVPRQLFCSLHRFACVLRCPARSELLYRGFARGPAYDALRRSPDWYTIHELLWYVIYQNTPSGRRSHTPAGERRIRVVTTALPTTANLSEVYSSVDQVAVATYLANKSVERALSSKLEDARDAVTNKVAEILTAYKNSMTGGGGGGQLATADNMKMLPVLALGLLKHVSSEFTYI